MPIRDQLLRHMDAACDFAGRSRKVVGFYAVDGEPPESEQVPEGWQQAVAQTPDSGVVARSLPHRGELERSEIVDGVLGAVTWQRICREFGIPVPPANDLPT
jgi:hypothetical protein